MRAVTVLFLLLVTCQTRLVRAVEQNEYLDHFEMSGLQESIALIEQEVATPYYDEHVSDQEPHSSMDISLQRDPSDFVSLQLIRSIVSNYMRFIRPTILSLLPDFPSIEHTSRLYVYVLIHTIHLAAMDPWIRVPVSRSMNELDNLLRTRNVSFHSRLIRYFALVLEFPELDVNHIGWSVMDDSSLERRRPS